MVKVSDATLLVGKKGSGKHTFVYSLAEDLGISVKDMTYETNLKESINNCYTVNHSIFYIINIDELGAVRYRDDKENALLKFIEEPPANAKVFLLTTNDGKVLKTVKNRCRRIVIPTIPLDKVVEVTGVKDGVCEYVYNTYGRLNEFSLEDYNNMKKLSTTIIEKLSMANFSNMLSITDKLKFKDGDDGFDYELFVDIFGKVLLSVVSEVYHIKMYNILSKFKKDNIGYTLDKRAGFQKMLIEMRRVSDEYRRTKDKDRE